MGRWFTVRSPRARLVVAPAVVLLAVVFVAAWRWLGGDSGWFALIVVWWPMVWVGTMSRLVLVNLPEQYHTLRRWERSGRVHAALGVGAAKAVLRRGVFAWFNPDLHLPAERTEAQLRHLTQRMRDAEASLAVLFVATLPVAGHALARGWWAAAALTMVFDIVMNGYPVLLQLYNRARLAARHDLDWV